jgi:hypothetical protein
MSAFWDGTEAEDPRYDSDGPVWTDVAYCSACGKSHGILFYPIDYDDPDGWDAYGVCDNTGRTVYARGD